MNELKLMIPSKVNHLGLIITGCLMLRDRGWQVTLEDRSDDPSNPFFGLPLCMAEYRGKRLAFDLWDGYQNPDGMKRALESCDLYFKRSFSEDRNRALFPEFADRMRPLGLYYRVTHPDSPINQPLLHSAARILTGRAPDRYFTPDRFEQLPEPPKGDPRILFNVELWNDQDPKLSVADNAERTRINAMRIAILRSLRAHFGDQFTGGLIDTPLARSLAPELIMDRQYTERSRYLKLVRSSDICIATMGLYESIGGKMGEYTAGSKAIVCECLRYTPTGDFAVGRNYLPFETARQCVTAVERLAADPAALLTMKQANRDYYLRYLKPDVLVKNALEEADRVFDLKC